MIFIIHYFFDFVFQSRWMAENKSTNIFALLLHVFVYSIGLTLCGIFLDKGAEWVILNALAHFIVDFFSSKFSTYFFKTKQTKSFWNVIGLDQCVHMLCLHYL